MDFTSHMQKIVGILGEDQQYVPVLGLARMVKVEFVDTPAEFMGITGNKPRVICTIADVPTPTAGDMWAIHGVNYISLSHKTNRETGLHDIPLEINQ